MSGITKNVTNAANWNKSANADNFVCTNNCLYKMVLGIDRLGDILNNPIELHSPKAITLPKINGDIKFDNVSFKYNISTPNVLEKFSLDIKAGTKVGLIGRSGSGKSTITKLI